MTEVRIIYSLFGSDEEIKSVCETLLFERLIACANRLAPCISHYEWQGEMQSKQEYPVLFKTTSERVAAAIERLSELSSYDVPAILSWPADHTNAQFANWVESQTGSK